MDFNTILVYKFMESFEAEVMDRTETWRFKLNGRRYEENRKEIQHAFAIMEEQIVPEYDDNVRSIYWNNILEEDKLSEEKHKSTAISLAANKVIY